MTDIPESPVPEPGAPGEVPEPPAQYLNQVPYPTAPPVAPPAAQAPPPNYVAPPVQGPPPGAIIVGAPPPPRSGQMPMPQPGYQAPGPSMASLLTGFEAAPPHAVPAEQVSIKLSGVSKHYGQLKAVDNIDLSIARGSIFGLIGPNGAGKSTLMSMIASLLIPTSGVVEVEGHNPVLEPRKVRERIGYMPDGLGVYERMDVREYIEFFAAANNVPREQWTDLTAGLLELVELEVKIDSPVNSLSRGMKQRLSLARALVHDPDLLILDEPASGLDPRARIDLRELMLHLQEMGKTLLVSSHILSELQEVCTHVGIMEAGQLLASGSPREILSRLGSNRQVTVRFADGTSQTFGVVDEQAQADLLRQLVTQENRDILEFTETSTNLEDVFMNVTQGIVQ